MVEVQERVINVEHVDISTLEEWEEKLARLKPFLPPFRIEWNRWRGFHLRAQGGPFTESEQSNVVKLLMIEFSDMSVEADSLPLGVEW